MHARSDCPEPSPIKLRPYSVRIGPRVMGKDVYEGGLDLRSLGVAQLDPGELLKMVVEEPWMVDNGLQNKRLATRDGSMVAPVDRTGRKLRACRDVGPGSE